MKYKGYAAALTMQDAEVLKRWIGQILRREGKRNVRDRPSYFLEKSERIWKISRESWRKSSAMRIDKATLTREEIDAVCVTQLSNHIFDMVDAVATGNQKGTDLYYELIALKGTADADFVYADEAVPKPLFCKSIDESGYGKKRLYQSRTASDCSQEKYGAV